MPKLIPKVPVGSSLFEPELEVSMSLHLALSGSAACWLVAVGQACVAGCVSVTLGALPYPDIVLACIDLLLESPLLDR